METTKQGHERALQNIKNAKSILSIAESAQQKQLELLQKLRDRLFKGKDQTLNLSQKKAIFTSLKAIHQEIIDIGENTSFNGTLFYDNENAGLGGLATGTKWSFNVGSGNSSQDSMDVFISLYNASTSAVIGTFWDFSEDDYEAIVGTMNTDHIDDNVEAVSTWIGRVGSAIERLNHKEDMIRSQITASEAVRSNYEDADFAKEQMELMKVQILQQTATAALAQANAAPQSVLNLFR